MNGELSANDFQAACLRTWQTDHPPLTPQMATIVNAAIGISGEAGELLDHIKKVMFHGQAEDLSEMKKEVGDILYYVAVLLDCYDMSMEDVMQANIDKLQDRHPDGYNGDKYSSIGRGDGALYNGVYEPAPVGENGHVFRDFG